MKAFKVKHVERIAPEVSSDQYALFDALDGTHPLQTAVPEACVMYSVRVLPRAQISYFNFRLAKEMGLLPPDHPHKLNPELSQKILETFALRIVNEWDIQHGSRFPRASLKKNKYMATRYLQLQHSDKMGRTSGDGRGLWNGVITHKGTNWDVSSRGTGVTRLAPGVVRSGKPLRTGNGEIGYGCGLAELDELYASAIQAGIFHLNGISTEQVLTIIDLGRGLGIGVRACPNLIRPAHLFPFLKQRNHDGLKRSVDYLIDRLTILPDWTPCPKEKNSYDHFLRWTAERFAQFAARLEREYIFAWLDWDGDNVLAQAGIIDYGSIRQFGLRHDQYRYDDIERFSTNLNEQRHKAKQIVQVYAQMIDFLKTKKLKPLQRFQKHAALRHFDETFDTSLQREFLRQLGFTAPHSRDLMKRHPKIVRQAYAALVRLEKRKWKGLIRVADGINRPPLGNTRHFLTQLATHTLCYAEDAHNLPKFSSADLAEWYWAKVVPPRHRHLSSSLQRQLMSFQQSYHRLLQLTHLSALEWYELVERCDRFNRPDRMTGDALIHVVEELLTARRKGVDDAGIQALIENLILHQVTHDSPAASGRHLTSSPHGELWEQIQLILLEHSEDI